MKHQINKLVIFDFKVYKLIDISVYNDEQFYELISPNGRVIMIPDSSVVEFLSDTTDQVKYTHLVTMWNRNTTSPAF